LNGNVVATANINTNAVTVAFSGELSSDVSLVQLSLANINNISLWTDIFQGTIATAGSPLYTSLNSWLAVRNTASVVLGFATIGIIVDGVLVERFVAYEQSATFVSRQILMASYEATTANPNAAIRIAGACLTGMEAKALYPSSTITLGNSGTNVFSIGTKR